MQMVGNLRPRSIRWPSMGAFRPGRAIRRGGNPIVAGVRSVFQSTRRRDVPRLTNAEEGSNPEFWYPMNMTYSLDNSSRGLFTGAACLYARYRPGYPQELLDDIVER